MNPNVQWSGRGRGMRRRDFRPEEKERIVSEAEGCTERGQIGELLRREGIYSSHLND